MSLYNLIHGFDPHASVCLRALSIHPDSIPRFRDAYLDGDQIVILTRTGGGNREAYQLENARLETHELFISGADDEFDRTFALFRFRIPEGEIGEALKKLAETIGPAKTLRQKTQEAMEALDRNDPEMLARTAAIREQLKNVLEKLGPE